MACGLHEKTLKLEPIVASQNVRYLPRVPPPMAALQGIFSSLKKTAILPIERGSPKSINPAKIHIIPSIQNKTKATLRLVQSTNLPWFFDDVFAFCFLCPGSQPPFKKSGASFWKMINPY